MLLVNTIGYFMFNKHGHPEKSIFGDINSQNPNAK